jgi:putative tryptophan/tyrosine transport system substrate-binding protein
MMRPREKPPMERRRDRLSRRQFVVGGGVVAAALGLPGACTLHLPSSPQAAKVHRIGFLTDNRPGTGDYEYFRRGLAEQGYVEGRDLVIDYRSAEGVVGRLPGLAAGLVSHPVDVIAAESAPSITAAKQATSTIPIVMVSVADPVQLGFVASLARPGGNLTGVSTLSPALSGKRVELLKATVPGLSRVAILWKVDNPGVGRMFKETETGANELGITVQSVEVRDPEDLDQAFEAVLQGGAQALIELPALPLREPTQTADFALKNRLPSIHATRSRVVAGGLMSYGPDYSVLARRAAAHVDKILKGARPEDIPVEQAMYFEFVVNLKTAQALGIIFSNEIMLQVTDVIQ